MLLALQLTQGTVTSSMALSKPFPIQNASISFGADSVYRLVDDLMSAGVVGSGDFAVSQRAAGANMSVDVATGTAVVAFTSPYGGKRRIVNDAVMNSGTPGSPGSGWTATFTSASGTNPRIDRVVLTVRDSNLDAGGNYDAVLAVVSGTATAGATLTNLSGAAAVPSNSLLLANVLIPAGSTSITTGNIDTTVRTRASVGSGNALPAYTGATFYRKNTNKTVNTTTTATDLLSGEISIGSGVMGTTGILRLTAYGDVLNNTGATQPVPRFQLVLGGVTLLDTGTFTGIGTSASRGLWHVHALIENLGSVTAQSATLSGVVFGPGGITATSAAFTTGQGYYEGTSSAKLNGVTNSGTANTSGTTALVLNVINGSASASYETKLFSALVEVV